VLADLVRTDAHNHRGIAGDTDLAEAVKILARAHQSMIWARGRPALPTQDQLGDLVPDGAQAAVGELTSGPGVVAKRRMSSLKWMDLSSDVHKQKRSRFRKRTCFTGDRSAGNRRRRLCQMSS